MRVIQDSDDESDGDLEVETHKPQIADTSKIQHQPVKDVSSSTGSTGVFTQRRTIFSSETYRQVQNP
jgi:hypothetical protein